MDTPIRNLAWLRQKVSTKVNFDVTQPDQDFIGPSSDTNQLVDDAINEAYVEEYTNVKLEAAPEWFMQTEEFTWAASEVTLDLRTVSLTASNHSVLRMEDITNSVDGDPISIKKSRHHSEIWWKDRYTLQWGTSGPGEDKTIQITFMPKPKDMRIATDEPDLIPEEHRWLLVWSAAINLRDMADEAAPQGWIQRRDNLRENMILDMAQGKVQRPTGNVIRNEIPNFNYQL
jgi:hypothetical protein